MTSIATAAFPPDDIPEPLSFGSALFFFVVLVSPLLIVVSVDLLDVLLSVVESIPVFVAVGVFGLPVTVFCVDSAPLESTAVVGDTLWVLLTRALDVDCSVGVTVSVDWLSVDEYSGVLGVPVSLSCEEFECVSLVGMSGLSVTVSVSGLRLDCCALFGVVCWNGCVELPLAVDELERGSRSVVADHAAGTSKQPTKTTWTGLSHLQWSSYIANATKLEKKCWLLVIFKVTSLFCCKERETMTKKLFKAVFILWYFNEIILYDWGPFTVFRDILFPKQIRWSPGFFKALFRNWQNISNLKMT